MTTDLLPSMNLPYAVVLTTYNGASPESVETVVTRPIEQSMATVSSIENVSSISRENMSLVILQFEETTDMDSVTIEMRENLDQISSYWDDTVGKPIIMKLNPDMLPVMIAAVEMDGMEATEVTDHVTDQIEPELESIAGVASVSTTGTITESVDVLIRQDKVEAMNQKVMEALDETFAEQEKELQEAQEEIDSGKSELKEGQEELDAGKESMASRIGQGEARLNQAQGELVKGEAELSLQLSQLESKEAQLQEARVQLEEGMAQAQEGLTALEETRSGLTALTEALGALAQKETELTEALAAAQEGLQTIEEQLAALDPQDPNYETIKAALEQQKAMLQEQIASMELAIGQLAEQRTELETQISQITEALGQPDAESAQSYLEGQITELNGTLQELEAGQEQLDAGKEQLEDAREAAREQASLENLITADLVKGILAGENFSMPAGYVTEEGVDYLIRVGDELEGEEDLEDMVILDLNLNGLEPIRLSDVADVTRTDNSDEVYARLNGNPGVMLTIEKQTGYSTGEVTDRLLERIDELESEDSNMHISVLMNQGIYIDLVIDSVLSNMYMGAILAIIILFFFLKDIRPTFVIALSIPISVVAAFVLMYFSGITLNIISLSGLALGVGMLVDNSIVVIENIYRMRREGVPARKAAVEGAQQVAGAIASSTLTTICVFLPIVFTEGITRQLFVDMGLTIAFSLLSSLAVALTLVPMMGAGLLKKAAAKKTPLLDRIQNAYGNSIRFALRYKWGVLAAAVVLLIASGVLIVSKGTSFMPEMESTQATITVTTEKGTLFQETTEQVDQVVAAIDDLEDIESIGAMAGDTSISSLLGGGSNTNSANIYLVLKEDKELSGQELEQEILERTSDLDCEVEVSTQSMDMSALGGSGIQVQIKGQDLDQLQKIAGDVAQIVSDVEGTTEVSDGMEDAEQEYRIVVNKSRAMEHGLTVAQVFQEVNSRLAEASSATTLSDASKDYEVYVRSDQDEELTREDLKDLTIEVTSRDGETEEIRIGDIADFQEAESPQSINRDAQSRYMSVTAQLEDGYNIGLVSRDVEEALADYEIPEGYAVEMIGEDETINDAMGQLYQMLALALVFIYLIMVAQFQSLLSPFIIMFTIPLAFTGGFLGLLLADMEISVIAMIGFVMLSGIIVNNGIVLVDYTNQLRREGMEKREALVQAGKDRLRPIVMTALTTILGLLTMAMGVGMGSEMVQPMAIVTIGGLLYGTLLTLFVVPCIYDLLNRKEYKKDELRLEDTENEQ